MAITKGSAAGFFGFEQIVEHRADQLFEPSQPLPRKTMDRFDESRRQSGENDNNLYCGDWWMANQMMERSLTWAGLPSTSAGKGVSVVR